MHCYTQSTTMESKIHSKVNLNRVENTLYIVVVTAIIVDVLVQKSSTLLLIISTSILIVGVLGIIGIECIKLQLKQRLKK